MKDAIINKGYLTEALTQYDRKRSADSLPMADFYQRSYCLYDPMERKNFFPSYRKRIAQTVSGFISPQ
jgi:hypothetical protein